MWNVDLGLFLTFLNFKNFKLMYSHFTTIVGTRSVVHCRNDLGRRLSRSQKKMNVSLEIACFGEF